MKYLVIFFTLLGLLIIPITAESFAEGSFNGHSSVDPPLSQIVAGQSSVMNIRFWYTSGPYAMENFAPVLEVNPSSARQFVQVDVDSIGITQGQIKRIPVTLAVDPQIEHDKIFLSISYVGHHFQTDELQKSSWNDQVALDVLVQDGVDSEKYRFIDFSYAHMVGEPIQFILEKTADADCNSYDAKITDEEGNFVFGWGAEISCSPDLTSSSTPIQTKIGYKEDRPIIINDSGKYYLEIDFDDVHISKEFVVRQNHSGVSLDRTVYPVPWSMSPLKQFKSGVPSDEIQCKEDMVLLKKHDDSPACVKPDSVIDLIKRNWLVTEDVGGYAIDYDGDVQHLPFADICTDEMKILLLTYSNIASPDEQFVMDDVALPSAMSQEDFARCAHETEFTKSRWNMISMENPEPKSSFTQRYHVSIFQNSKPMTQYITPDFITIGPEQKVTWSNYDKISHTITSNDPEHPWSTGTIIPDGYATITFNKTGVYEYHGKPWMNGVIVVMDDDGQLLESEFSEVFGPGSPLVYNEGLRPVFLYDNCERYVYWLNEHGKEKITLPEDYPRYPPWGKQIFPLVEFCTSNGDIVNTGDENSVRWEFKIENEN